MKRKILSPRTDWQLEHQKIGFDYFNLPSLDGSIYWSEGIAYEFTLKQIEQLEDAANELHQMCLAVTSDLIQRGNYPDYFQIPSAAIAQKNGNHQSDNNYGNNSRDVVINDNHDRGRGYDDRGRGNRYSAEREKNMQIAQINRY